MQVGNDSIGISYCGKDEFRAIIEALLEIHYRTGSPGKCILEVLEEPDASIAKHLTNDMLHYQERRKAHNPIRQERREQESIRRGDLQALEESINESYGGGDRKCFQGCTKTLQKYSSMGDQQCVSKRHSGRSHPGKSLVYV